MITAIIATLLLLISPIIGGEPSEKIPFQENRTYTYHRLIEAYHQLDEAHTYAKLIDAGKSDNGKPIHLFVIDKDENFSPEKAHQSKKTIVLINNGIHAGEACGIDASVELAKNLLNKKHSLHKSLDSVVVLIVPAYNIGGILNRGKFSRANQNGPEEHGFRGNAKNLDLNRDFIKCDSRNARTFSALFNDWNPDIFIDTHTTNGSNHQYTLTLIATQKDKLNPVLSDYMQKEMLPELYADMKSKKMELTPYVYSLYKSPNKGIKDFLETPRYSSGYAALFDCFSFITEAHVYKSFKERVVHTQGFLESIISFSAINKTAIKECREKAVAKTLQQETFPIQWELDSSEYRTIPFKGFQTEKRVSEVTGNEMMFYNTELKTNDSIQYFNTYKVSKSIKKPRAYIVPQAYSNVLDLLTLNGVTIKSLNTDTIMEVMVAYITDYKTPRKPYEAHYLHSDIRTTSQMEQIQLYAGDAIVSTNQEKVRYIVETLEAESVDGFFAWNFFDGVLQQKEWFSDYAFEPIAKRLLEENKELKNEFEDKKRMDSTFASDNFAQLYYIYKRSPYFEKTANRYPVYRIE